LPPAARAQRTPEIPKFGFVYQGSQAAMAVRVEAILSGLRVSGYAAPARVEIVARAAEGDLAKIAPLVAEVIASNVSVILASGFPILSAARSATRTIPIVAIDFETDPVASGVVASLARPGATSLVYSSTFRTSRRSGWRCWSSAIQSYRALPHCGTQTTGTLQRDSVRKAAGSLNVQLGIVEVHRASDFDAAFSLANQRGMDAIVLLSSPLIAPNVQVLAELALRHRLPAITLFPDFARAGGLLAYRPNLLNMYQLIGVLAGKIARGGDPAALPIERPTKFETVLNKRTADALGISIPASLLLRVDEIIE
jgi:putative tryptophan/tyrosine transport system substrate-binding protein